MTVRSSETAEDSPGWSNDIQPGWIDEVDRRILNALHDDARIPNSVLADMVGIAPSTCHGRLRRLQNLGVIRGFYTDVDPAAIGRPLQAMISVGTPTRISLLCREGCTNCEEDSALLQSHHRIFDSIGI